MKSGGSSSSGFAVQSTSVVSKTDGSSDVVSGSEVLGNEVSTGSHHLGGMSGVVVVGSDVLSPDLAAGEVAVEGTVVPEGVLGDGVVVHLGGDDGGKGEGGEGESHVGKWRKLFYQKIINNERLIR